VKHCHPLKHILKQGRAHWDRNEVAPAVRRALEMAVQCRTAALGAEVYASERQERIVYHTCKSRACASCGHRATILWQRERWVALPDVPYKGITFHDAEGLLGSL
jgi:transposase-like zinc-binding protein